MIFSFLTNSRLLLNRCIFYQNNSLNETGEELIKKLKNIANN
jgi:hypothetical protein